MALLDTVDTIERQEWLEPASSGVQRAVGSLIARQPVMRRTIDFLNGTWFGHPLHPALSDIPVGAWTTAFALDGAEMLSGRRELAPTADAAVVVGLVGGLGSAITGLADWQYTDSRPRRIGLAHALLNASAMALYTTSLALRLRGARKAGRLTALLGYVTVVGSSYLGADLVFAERIGPTHAPTQELPSVFVPVLAEWDLPEGAMRRVDVAGVPVLLVRQHGRIYALGETCAHLGGPLSEGQLEEGCIVCPWHGSRFALEDGAILNGPTTFPQPRYLTRIRDGQIEVRRITLPSPDGR